MKTCCRCNQTKDESEFYKNKKYGLNPACKDCIRKAQNEYSNTERSKQIRANYRQSEDFQAVRDKYNATEKGRRTKRINNDRFKARHPDRELARNAVRMAVFERKLMKGSCEQCGENNDVHAHHWDEIAPYSRENWLKIRWLCRKCHNEEHKRRKEIFGENQEFSEQKEN